MEFEVEVEDENKYIRKNRQLFYSGHFVEVSNCIKATFCLI